MQLVAKDGSLVEVPEAEAHAAVQSGEYGWQADEPVHVVLPSGKVGSVAPEKASSVLARGAKLATPEEVHAAQLEARHGGLGGTLAATGEGAARGLTLGLSDPFAVDTANLLGGEGAGEATREHLAEEKEAHPYASTGGELLGAVAPIALSGGAAAPEEGAALFSRALAGGEDAVRTLGAIPRVANAAGEYASRLAERFVGSGAESALGKAAQTAVKHAASNLVEGGIFAGGAEVSDATLKNEPLTAEKMLTAIGHGALMTGAVGATLGGFGSLGGSALGAIAEHTDGAVEKLANEQYIRALNANKKSLITEAKDRFGSLDVVADRVRQEGIVQAGDDVERIAAKAARADASAIDGLQASVEKVGATGVKIGDVTDALERRARTEDGILGHEAAADAIRKQIDNINRIYEGRMAAAERRAKSVYDIGLAPGETTAPRATKAIAIGSHREPFAIDANAGLLDAGDMGWRIDEHGDPVPHFGEDEAPIKIDVTRPGHIGDGPIIDPNMTEGADIGQGGIGIRKAYDVGLKPESTVGGESLTGSKEGLAAYRAFKRSPPIETAEDVLNGGRSPAKLEEMAQAEGERAAAEARGKFASPIRKPVHITKDAEESARLAMQARRDATISLRDLLDQRRQLERTINWQTDTVIAQGRKAAGRTIEDAVMNAGDEAAAAKLEAGAANTWREEYQAAKRRFSEVRWIKDVTDDALDAKIRNRAISPSDYIAGAAGIAGGLTHGLTGGLGGVAMGALHHVVRERGNSTAAVFLDKLASFDGISQAAKDVTDRTVSAITSALSAKAAVATVPEVSEGRYARERERVSQLGGMTSAALSQHLEEQTAGIETHAPGLAKALQSKAALATTFLASKLPPGGDKTMTLTPQLVKSGASAQQRATFLRYVDAVEGGPPAILRKLARGTMTLEDAEVLQKIYPESFDEIRSEVAKQCAARKAPLPLQTAMRLGTLFGLPTCPELAPDFLQAQARLAATPEPKPAGAGGKKRGSTQAKLRISDDVQGPFERASAGE